LLASFEELQRKNKLSTDEMLRYMDITTLLRDAKTEHAVKILTDEQDKLREISGLTNKQTETFISLNKQIVENAPVTAQAISDQGNAYVDVLDEVKKLNVAERERLTAQTGEVLIAETRKQTKELEKQKALTEEINSKEK